MAEVRKNVLIEFTPAQMFALVDQCEDYAEFLPWCGGAQVHERTDAITAATIHVHYHGIKTHFSTRNSKTFPTRMDIALVDGPFRQLEGGWRFTPLGEAACRVDFELRYQFSSRVLEKALGPVFNHIVTTFVDAFVKRARALHRPTHP